MECSKNLYQGIRQEYLQKNPSEIPLRIFIIIPLTQLVPIGNISLKTQQLNAY